MRSKAASAKQDNEDEIEKEIEVRKPRLEKRKKMDHKSPSQKQANGAKKGIQRYASAAPVKMPFKRPRRLSKHR